MEDLNNKNYFSVIYGAVLIYSYRLQSSMFEYICKILFHLSFMPQKSRILSFSLRLLPIEK